MLKMFILLSHFFIQFGNLKLGETFLGGFGLIDFDNVEFDGLGQWSAFTNSYQIALGDIEKAWAYVSGKHFMALFESVVLLDVMKVITTDGTSTLHLQFGNDTG